MKTVVTSPTIVTKLALCLCNQLLECDNALWVVSYHIIYNDLDA